MKNVMSGVYSKKECCYFLFILGKDFPHDQFKFLSVIYGKMFC